MATIMLTAGNTTPIAIVPGVPKPPFPPPDTGDDADLDADAVALEGAVVPDEALAEDPQSRAKLNKCNELTQNSNGCSAGAFVALKVHPGSLWKITSILAVIRVLSQPS